MINYLCVFLQQYNSCQIREKEAKEILNFIEIAGMSPPKFQELVEINKNGKSLSYLFDRNGWESEEDFILDGEKGEL